MRLGCRSALYVFGAVATVGLSFVTALEVSIAAMPTPGGVNVGTVNRSNKADRLPGAQVVNPVSVQPLDQPRLPEGCLAASAWHKTSIYANEIAGRCVV
jgi:hypothetical protein